MIAIINYDIGNVGSIVNMLKKVGSKSVIVEKPGEVEKADKIILPGVGHFDRGIERIERKGLTPILKQKALEEKVPILGICLGMQLFTKGSEEGRRPGLGWIPAKTIRFRFHEESTLKIPHMGWNTVSCSKPSLLPQISMMELGFILFIHTMLW